MAMESLSEQKTENAQNVGSGRNLTKNEENFENIPWNCPNCGSMNTGETTVCVQCHEKMPLYEILRRERVPKYKNMAKEKVDDQSQKSPEAKQILLRFINKYYRGDRPPEAEARRALPGCRLGEHSTGEGGVKTMTPGALEGNVGRDRVQGVGYRV